MTGRVCFRGVPVLTCVCWGMFRKLLSRDPMLTNLLGVVEPGVEYAGVKKRDKDKQIRPKES